MSQLKEINSKYYKNCKVVMLPTNEKAQSIIYFDCDSKLSIGFNIFRTLPDISQHLYITSDEEIKENDWSYDRMMQSIGQHNNVYSSKIIATTDFKISPNSLQAIIPKLSQQFIEKYIEEYNKGNVITDVLVEYDKADYNKWMDNGASPVFDTIKKNPKKNTITIKEVKELWNRKEIKEIGLNFLKFLAQDHNHRFNTEDEIWKYWIKENL